MSRPIGFWLKLIDGLIDEQFAQTIEAHGVTRRQWQLLSVLRPEPTSLDELDAAVAPFLSSHESTTASQTESSAEHLAELVESGWVSRDDDDYALTASGADAFGRLGEVVAELRRGMADGISPEDYERTISTLERMARNLGWDDEASSEATG